MALSSGRNGTRVIWVVVHTAEGIRKAADLKAFFDRSTNSSAHAVADDVTLLDNLVPYGNASWTLRNGNSRSDNLELCGFASWSRAEWINNHQGMLTNAAIWIRSRCHARGIPVVKLSPADVRAGRAGVIGHVDYTQGAGDGTHWDPGPGFPWDVVIARAAGGGSEDDMFEQVDRDALYALGERFKAVFDLADKVRADASPASVRGNRSEFVVGLKALAGRTEALLNDKPAVTYGPTVGEPNKLHQELASHKAELAELRAATKAPVVVDYDRIVSGVVAHLEANPPQAVVDAAAVAKAVNDELARRAAD
jgi:hypothetical protein